MRLFFCLDARELAFEADDVPFGGLAVIKMPCNAENEGVLLSCCFVSLADFVHSLFPAQLLTVQTVFAGIEHCWREAQAPLLEI
jgi:hypothetical protein